MHVKYAGCMPLDSTELRQNLHWFLLQLAMVRTNIVFEIAHATLSPWFRFVILTHMCI